ncbi:MAG: hypothetical protein AABY22_13570 [Nanoarchaeota archaeon]
MLKYLLVLFLALTGFSQGYKNVIVSWDSEPVNGYFVYYYSEGITNRINSIEKFVFINIGVDKIYGFYVTAYNDEKWESDPSNIVFFDSSLDSSDIVLQIENNNLKLKAIGGFKYIFEYSENLENWDTFTVLDVYTNKDLSVLINKNKPKEYYRIKVLNLP